MLIRMYYGDKNYSKHLRFMYVANAIDVVDNLPTRKVMTGQSA